MTIDWYKAAQCAMRNKNRSLPDIAAAMAEEQPAVIPTIKPGKSYARWAGLDSGGIAELQVDTGWGGMGEIDATILAIFETREIAEERYSGVSRVTVTMDE